MGDGNWVHLKLNILSRDLDKRERKMVRDTEWWSAGCCMKNVNNFVSGGQLSAYRCEYVGKKICALLRMSD